MQGHRTVLNTGAKSTLKFNMKCPDGHSVEVNIGGTNVVTDNVPDVEAVKKEQAERMKEAQKPGLEAQIKMLDDMIAQQQKMMQEQIDRLTKQRDEVKAKLAALG
jgi:uncharacterized protein (UPF0254 family)